MNFLLPLVLVAAQAAATADQRYAGSVEVFACDFETKYDTNFDYWPDNWTRRRGLGFPQYLKVAITPPYEQQPTTNHALRLELDGGSIQVNSPRFEIQPTFDYVLEGRVRTEKLTNNFAFVSVVLYDAQHNSIETFSSEDFFQVDDWQTFRVGPFSSASGKAVRAVIQLHLRSSGKSDLHGVALFDDLCLRKLPHLRLQTNSPFNIYSAADPIAITGSVSTLRAEPVEVEFTLFDADNDEVAHSKQTVTESVKWEPLVPGKGFYRLLATMRISGDLKLRRELSIAVVDSVKLPVRGEFGWSLSRDSHSIPMKLLPDLFGRAAVNWVKLPLWKEADDPQQCLQIGWLAERLRMRGIQLVGMLDEPPDDVRKHFRNIEKLPIGEVFSDETVWPAAIDAVMSQMSLYVHWWQLGSDNDASFADLTDMDKLFRQAQKHIGQFGTNLRLGLVWPWLQETPPRNQQAWDFLSRTVSIPFTQDELKGYLKRENLQMASRQWVMLESLSRDEYDTVTRANDLVVRMISAKVGRSEGIFLRNPFDADYGLMTAEGSPTELFLPWRTTSLMLTGARYLGSITLPHGSRNHLFARGDDITMVVWNDHPTKERLYLGNELTATDVWGRTNKIDDITDENGSHQEIEVGPLPTFITGLNPFVARWRLAFQIVNSRLEIAPGRVQKVGYRYENTNDFGVSGTMLFQVPSAWRVAGKRVDVNLGTKRGLEPSLEVQLGSEANTGVYPIRIDCELQADRSYRFSIYDNLQVGFGNLEIQMTSRLDESGYLIVEQTLINQTEKAVSFNCELFVPERSREQKTIRNLGQGEAVNTFVLPNGKDLIGQKLWLRATEIDGDRSLNAELEAVR